MIQIELGLFSFFLEHGFHFSIISTYPCMDFNYLENSNF